MSAFSEDTYEQALIELFQSLEGKQYRYEYGPDIVRNYADPILHDVLLESLQRINPSLPMSAIDDTIKKLHRRSMSVTSSSPRCCSMALR